ncbi:MAG: hypothetical protein MJ172_02555 [Clostridia bacterium]|nr:hypothetical protein [Clostridia bacterium]
MNNEAILHVFSNAIEITSLLIKQSSILCELLDSNEDEMATRRVSSVAEEIDSLVMQQSIIEYDMDLKNDPQAIYLFDFYNLMLDISKNIDYVGRAFIRYNIHGVKEEIYGPITDIDKSNKILMDIFVHLKNGVDKKNSIPKILELRKLYFINSNRYDENMKVLFSDPDDILEVIKMRALYTAINRVYLCFNDMVTLLMKYFMFANN